MSELDLSGLFAKSPPAPNEYELLKGAPYAREICPKCGISFPEFLRGMVQRSKRFLGFLWERPYCAIICHNCKNIIGWEFPPKQP